eukprot:10351202-Alexandrium_andersonii.AAC.1
MASCSSRYFVCHHSMLSLGRPTLPALACLLSNQSDHRSVVRKRAHSCTRVFESAHSRTQRSRAHAIEKPGR